MVGTFLRHGSNIWLALGLAVLIVCFVARVLPLSLLWAVIGALTFYVSEYGFHRFGFDAEPSRFAFVRKLQHRLHYDHHAEPDRLDLLFLPVWFLTPAQVAWFWEGGPDGSIVCTASPVTMCEALAWLLRTDQSSAQTLRGTRICFGHCGGEEATLGW